MKRSNLEISPRWPPYYAEQREKVTCENKRPSCFSCVHGSFWDWVSKLDLTFPYLYINFCKTILAVGREIQSNDLKSKRHKRWEIEDKRGRFIQTASVVR